MIKIARFRKREKYTLKFLISEIKTVNVIDEEYENVFHKISPNGHFRLSALGHYSNHGIHSNLIHPTSFSLVKIGDRTDCNNYRPITVIPTFSKILERAVHQQLYEFLSANELLTPNQFCFLPKLSTVKCSFLHSTLNFHP